MVYPAWVTSQKSHVWIFNVGRGLAIFIRTPQNHGIIYDFGSSKDFKPTEFLQENIIPHLGNYNNCKLAQTIISHPHYDHLSDIEFIVNPENKHDFHSCLHTCPHDKTGGSAEPEAIDWGRINNPEGVKSTVDIYKSLYAERSLPLQTIQYYSDISIPNLEYGLFYVRPPVVDHLFPSDDQEYTNGLSLVVYYRHGHHTLLIPGDINPDTFKHLLDECEGHEKRYTILDRSKIKENPNWHCASTDQPSLKSLLEQHGLSILVAPHHGLESGFSEDLYRAIKDEKPDLVAISEKRHLSETDGKVEQYYQTKDGAKGLRVTVDGEQEDRYSVSTRNGHHILIIFQGTGGQPKVFLDKDPLKLLDAL
jgi:hypothetical protein